MDKKTNHLKYEKMSPEEKDREDIRTAYQTIIQMIGTENNNQWSTTTICIQFSVALIAASFVPIDKLLQLPEVWKYILDFFLAILGLFTIILWMSLNSRYEKIAKYWILSARELEEKMSIHVQAFQRGRQLSLGQVVEVSGEEIGYKGLAKILPIRVGYTIIQIAF